VDPACRCRTIAVTASVMIPVELTIVIRLPACSPNRAAVCGVTATASVPAGWGPAARLPATTEASLVSELR